MFSFIEILRALAVALITNSHFDGVYPIDISWGGAPGVSLFFIITGFLLSGGGTPQTLQQFWRWYGKKLIRLYVPLTIVNIITVIIGYRTASIMLFLFPININLWYVPAIAILYVLFCVVMKWLKQYRIHLIGLTVVIYAIVYIFFFDKSEFFVEPVIGFRLMYGFIAMLLGSMLRDRLERGEKMYFKAIPAFLFGCLCIIGFLAVKLLVSRVDLVMRLQFMTQVFSVAFAWFAVQWGVAVEDKAGKLMKTWLGKIVGVISTCSLEIYLIQFPIISYLKEIVFPVNFVLIVVCIVIAGWLVHLLSEVIIKQINKAIGVSKS